MVLEVEQFNIKAPGNSVSVKIILFIIASLSYHYHIQYHIISVYYHIISMSLSYHGTHMCPHMVEKQWFPLIPPCRLLQYRFTFGSAGKHQDHTLCAVISLWS